MADPGPRRGPGHRRPRAADRLRQQRPAGGDAGRFGRRVRHRYGVRAGARAVVFTNNDSAYAAAADLSAAGIEVGAIVDFRREGSGVPVPPGIDVVAGHVVVSAHGAGAGRVGDRRAARWRGRRGSGRRPPGCVGRLESGGPPVQPVRRHHPLGRATAAAFVPSAARQRVRVVGAANGKGLSPVEPCGSSTAADLTVSFVDLQRDVTVADLRRATGTGMRRWSTSSATPPPAPRTIRARRPASWRRR